MPYAVKAFALQATPKTLWCFLQVTADDGYTGWGEFTIGYPRVELSATFSQFLGQLTASDFDLDGRRRGPQLMDQRILSALYTALDQAVFDIHAQKQNRKLVDLLAPGCRNDSVSLYANINRSVIQRSPEAFAARALEAKAAGFDAIKMAPFDDLTPELCGSDVGRRLLDTGARRIQAVRDAIGPEMSLMVDCHWRFDEETADQALGFLTASSVSWYECPLPETADTIGPLLKLRSKANDRGMRLAGCEKFTGWTQFQPFVENQVYDVIMPDAKYAGGMREIMDVGRRAMKHGVAVSLHNPSGPISHAVSLHIAAALDNGMPLEFQFNETPLFDQIADGVIPARTGRSGLPDGVGTGIGLLEARLSPLAE
ncbi:MAG: hypothetical protein HQ483_02540 [Rhodospirillales bacterium]|nr:hypothetical protein [Rhodospirillales bacterium]